MIGELVQDISYKELQLAILTGEVQLDGLHVFKSSNVMVKDIGVEVRAAIIGTSHYIQFRFEEMIFTEMLACDASKEFGGEKLFLKDIPSMDTPFLFKDQHIQYSFSHRVSKCDESLLKLNEKWNELKDSSSLVHLQHEFNLDSSLPSARTLIAVNRLEKGLSIFTAHEYQEENSVVFSNSVISRS